MTIVCRNAPRTRRPASYRSAFMWWSPTGHPKGMLIITAPGQGAQTPGFVAPSPEVPGGAERLGAPSALAGCDRIRYGHTAVARGIRATPRAGARLRPLQVAGAFHTRYMAPAVAALRDAAAEVSVTDPHLTLLCNADGAAVTTGKEWLERIVAQVAAPVRWDLCLRTMADLCVTAIIELPPAGTLTGLARP